MNNLFESKPILNVLKPVNVGDNIKPSMEEQLKIAIKALEKINKNFHENIEADGNPFPVSWMEATLYASNVAGEALDMIEGIDPFEPEDEE